MFFVHFHEQGFLYEIVSHRNEGVASCLVGFFNESFSEGFGFSGDLYKDVFAPLEFRAVIYEHFCQFS